MLLELDISMLELFMLFLQFLELNSIRPSLFIFIVQTKVAKNILLNSPSALQKTVIQIWNTFLYWVNYSHTTCHINPNSV